MEIQKSNNNSEKNIKERKRERERQERWEEGGGRKEERIKKKNTQIQQKPCIPVFKLECHDIMGIKLLLVSLLF